MTLTDCQLLSIVAQLGTFAAAAERLHITPSAVSHAVSGVEAECGFPLFTRTKSGVTLTAAAEKLMPAIQQMLASSESLDQSIAQINGMHKGALINRLTGSPATSEMLPSGGPELLVQFLALCVMPAIAEELLFRGAFQGLMRPCGSAAAIFAPALLFGVLHLDLAQGLTAFACGVFLGWLAERSGSILPGMLLHLVNNALAFLTIYLRYYAPAEVSFGVELFILLFFPAFGAWMICNARRQGFSFSAGLRPGVDVLTVFTSPVYCATVLFLVAYAAIFVH